MGVFVEENLKVDKIYVYFYVGIIIIYNDVLHYDQKR